MRGHCPGVAFLDTAQGAAGLCACPTTGHPGRAQLALPGWFGMERKREKGRQAEAGLSFCQGCSGVLQAGVKVHRGKGRVRGLEGGGHYGGARASSRQRGIPQKRPLELHRGEKEQERKREEREVESVTAQGKAQVNQLRSQGGGGGAATQQVTGWCFGAANWLGQAAVAWGQSVPAITHPRKPCRPRWARSPGCSACCCGSGTRRRC